MRKRLLIALPLVLFVTVGISAAATGGTPARPRIPASSRTAPPPARPSGWQSTGKRSADFTEAGGHSGGFHLSHWSAEPLQGRDDPAGVRPASRLVHASRLGARECG